mmetsp:Transcript_51779/g.150515  ORF Transcript_51779/g.150515 Transcript_51779/m.150515 type:complete len:270 (-) Transcript_51779:691-1500(-)
MCRYCGGRAMRMLFLASTFRLHFGQSYLLLPSNISSGNAVSANNSSKRTGGGGAFCFRTPVALFFEIFSGPAAGACASCNAATASAAEADGHVANTVGGGGGVAEVGGEGCEGGGEALLPTPPRLPAPPDSRVRRARSSKKASFRSKVWPGCSRHVRHWETSPWKRRGMKPPPAQALASLPFFSLLPSPRARSSQSNSKVENSVASSCSTASTPVTFTNSLGSTAARRPLAMRAKTRCSACTTSLPDAACNKCLRKSTLKNKYCKRLLR